MTLPASDPAASPVRVPVDLGSRSYDILVGSNLLVESGSSLKSVLKNPRVAIVTDETVAALHLHALEQTLDHIGIEHSTHIFPTGEGSKSIAVYGDLMSQLLDARIQRDEALIALGGGVIGDLTGFAAATLRRGVDFIQIPTTLLSQVDSSVGGKTGINAAQGKNLIGAFYQPKLVLADISLLDSLPHREIIAGYAEVVKYGLLGDRDFFEWLEANGKKVIEGDEAARIYAVEQSVKAKAQIVVKVAYALSSILAIHLVTRLRRKPVTDRTSTMVKPFLSAWSWPRNYRQNLGFSIVRISAALSHISRMSAFRLPFHALPILIGMQKNFLPICGRIKKSAAAKLC